MSEGARRLLEWYAAMGVDAALDENPRDWLAHGSAAPGAALRTALAGETRAATPMSAPPPRANRSGSALPPTAAPQRPLPPRSPPPAAAPYQPRPAPAPSDAATLTAREEARKAQSLDELRAILDRFEGCGLKATAKNLCFYRGSATPKLMIIGEAPGRDEDLEGKPFVGRAGQLLDKMLAAIGLGEADVHVTNIVYWRPPGNRTPTPQEAQVCRPFLERQIELARPRALFLLGGPAAKLILDVQDGIMRVRGKWRTIAVASRDISVMPTLHPAYLLRTPAAKRLAWRDLREVKARLAQLE